MGVGGVKGEGGKSRPGVLFRVRGSGDDGFFFAASSRLA